MPATPTSRSRHRAGLCTLTTVALVVVSVVVAAIIGGVVRGADDPGRGPRVLVVGDSVAYQSAADLIMTFDWTSNIEVHGRPGFRTDELIPVARQAMAAGRYQTVVVMTGYNDLLQEVDASSVLAEMVEAVATAPCAVWVLIPTKGDYAPEAAAAFNDRVEELAAGHDQLHAESAWRDAADATDGPDPDPRLVSDDGVHPTEDGTAKIAAVVEAAVSRACR